MPCPGGCAPFPRSRGGTTLPGRHVMVTAVRRVGGALAVAAATGAVAVVLATGGAVAGAAVATSAPSSSECRLAHGVKHVIEITFDNVHYNRDNPNVLSDLEQMPALTNF